MPYDPVLAERIRDLLTAVDGLVEKKMFGGIGWTIRGNMAVGAHSDGNLMVRATREDWAEWLESPGVQGIERGGKPLAGWLIVDADTVVDDAALASWVERGRSYAASLPAKKKRSR